MLLFLTFPLSFLEMHAAVEEVDLDPCDLYTDLGTLIVEGRVPGQNDKGFGEGPHCFSTTPSGQNRHQCDPTTPEVCSLNSLYFYHEQGCSQGDSVGLYPPLNRVFFRCNYTTLLVIKSF